MGDCFIQLHNINFKELGSLSPDTIPLPLGLVAQCMP